MIVYPRLNLAGLDESVTRAVIGYLADQGVGVASGSPLTTATSPLLIAYDVPSTPARIVMVSAHLRDIDPATAVVNVALQVVTRGAPHDRFAPGQIGGAAVTALHNVHHARWSGLEVARCFHESTALLGPDSDYRWSRSDNFILTTQGALA